MGSEGRADCPRVPRYIASQRSAAISFFPKQSVCSYRTDGLKRSVLNVSLIIPTGNRSGSLQRLLNSVDVLVIPPNLVANYLRYGLYRIAGKSQKAYKPKVGS